MRRTIYKTSKNLFYRSWRIQPHVFLLVLFFGTLATMANTFSAEIKGNKDTFIPTNIGREFGYLSVHPDGKELLFVEHQGGKTTKNYRSDIFKYNIETKKYQKFVLPAGYLYSSPNFSPKGDFILITRIPIFQNYDERKKEYPYEEIKKSYSKTQVLFMDTDGKNLKILPLPASRMDTPIMSDDENRIAYTVITPSPNERFVGDWATVEFWEFNLKTNQNSLFSGPHEFIDGQAIQYIHENELLVSSDGYHGVNISEFYTKYNRSRVYFLKRNTKELPIPKFIYVTEAVGYPSIDNRNNIYLMGYQYTKTGNNIFKISPEGRKTAYSIPESLRESQLHNVHVTKDGKKIFFFYHAVGYEISDWKTAIGQFDIESSQWSTVAIPNIESSVPIFCK